nr:methyltransferase domain-containing protein [Streptomyces sp. MH60]
MRARRPAGAARCVAAAAESLPFEDRSSGAAMAFSTVHHWHDPIAGLRETRRVTRRVVVFTHDTSDTGWRHRFWLPRTACPRSRTRSRTSSRTGPRWTAGPRDRGPAPRRPLLRPLDRARPRPLDLDAAELGLRLLVA